MKKSKIISLLLAAAMLLTACGGGDTDTAQSSGMDKNAVFKEVPGAFSLEEGDVSNTVVVGDTLYVEQYVYHYNAPQARTEVTEEETEDVMVEAESSATMSRVITGYTADGEKTLQIKQELSTNMGGGYFTADTQGNIYSIMRYYATYEGDDTVDKIYLECLDSNGNEKWKIHLNENAGAEDYFSTGEIYYTQQDQLIVDTMRGIEIYDNQGNPIKIIEKPNTNDCRLIQIRDGKYALIGSDGSTAGIQTLDITSGTIGERVVLGFNYYRYQVMDGLEYDIYLSDDYGVYGYNIGDQEPVTVIDYVSSDFEANYLYQAAFLDKDTMVACYFNDEGVKLSKFIKVAPEDVIDKTEMTLGCYYLDPSVKRELVKFNKNNNQYRIRVKDYAMYDTMEDYTQGLTRLNTDIISGDIPDILLLDNQMPVESYISKGVLADLYTFMEEDPEVKKEDFLPNILEALSHDGGLYRLSPSFSVTTFAAKTADVGEESGWTMDEALALVASKPEGTRLLNDMTSSSYIYYTMWICGEQYVDWENGKCYFDSEGFKKTLEYANTLPREIDYTTITDDESYWQEMETQYRSGKTILSLQSLASFRDYAYAKQATFGEEVTYIGFPVEDGKGAGLNFGVSIAISATSKHQDAAWDFVRNFFTQEGQKAMDYNFPIRMESLKEMEKRAWEKPYTIDENGNKQEYTDYFYINDMEVEAIPLTEEETSRIVDYLLSLDKVCIYNESLNNIVTEETESYFSGQKSVDTVMEVIQSRAEIYVNENS